MNNRTVHQTNPGCLQTINMRQSCVTQPSRMSSLEKEDKNKRVTRTFKTFGKNLIKSTFLNLHLISNPKRVHPWLFVSHIFWVYAVCETLQSSSTKHRGSNRHSVLRDRLSMSVFPCCPRSEDASMLPCVLLSHCETDPLGCLQPLIAIIPE